MGDDDVVMGARGGEKGLLRNDCVGGGVACRDASEARKLV